MTPFAEFLPRAMRHWLIALLLAGMAAAVQAQDKPCAIVLMHGKWGNPQQMASFGRKIESACAYKSIEMPWSQRRSYDQPYAAALKDVAAQVKELRAQGYRHVLVGGQSFGANGALAYMAEIGDADGVLALSPGHAPEGMYARGGPARESVDKARELVAAGKGGEMLSIMDSNQGQNRSMRMSAEVMLSYFDPRGLGNMSRSAMSFKKAVPVMIVIGTGDPAFGAGQGRIFNRLPPHPLSQYVVMESDHFNAGEAAADKVVEWLHSLDKAQ